MRIKRISIRNVLEFPVMVHAISDDDPHYRDTMKLRPKEIKVFHYWDDEHTQILIEKAKR